MAVDTAETIGTGQLMTDLARLDAEGGNQRGSGRFVICGIDRPGQLLGHLWRIGRHTGDHVGANLEALRDGLMQNVVFQFRSDPIEKRWKTSFVAQFGSADEGLVDLGIGTAPAVSLVTHGAACIIDEMFGSDLCLVSHLCLDRPDQIDDPGHHRIIEIVSRTSCWWIL